MIGYLNGKQKKFKKINKGCENKSCYGGGGGGGGALISAVFPGGYLR